MRLSFYSQTYETTLFQGIRLRLMMLLVSHTATITSIETTGETPNYLDCRSCYLRTNGGGNVIRSLQCLQRRIALCCSF